jgi:hypothetical protein
LSIYLDPKIVLIYRPHPVNQPRAPASWPLSVPRPYLASRR